MPSTINMKLDTIYFDYIKNKKNSTKHEFMMKKEDQLTY